MSNEWQQAIVQRLFRNFLDVMVLKLLEKEPMWGYKIKKRVEEQYGIKLRHGALYPLLKALQKEAALNSRIDPKGGRVRKVYEITSKGKAMIEAYNEIFNTQV